LKIAVTTARTSISGSFEADTVQALAQVRARFSQLVEAKCPVNPSVSEIAEAFGIHRKLAWQVGKVAYSADPFYAAKHVPSPRSLNVWLEAARRAGCPQELVREAEGAAQRFHSLAAAHTRSEQEFEMLLESCAQADEAAHARWRQQSFLGNSFVWGAHCKVLLSMMVFQPSRERQGFFHLAQVRGLIGFRQTRPNVRWVINQSVVADDNAQVNTGLQREALDPEEAREHLGVPVLPQFCSSPMPEFSRRVTPNGMIADEFLSGPVGHAGERTLVTGEVIRNLGFAYATEQDKIAHFGAAVRIPAERLHMDLFVHHSLFRGVERELCMFSDLNSDVAFEASDSLPIPERIRPLGRGVALAQTPDIPSYPELASTVFARLGAEASEYDLFRVRVPYPPMPVSIMVRHPLPPAS
jgi:hypothetical protein